MWELPAQVHSALDRLHAAGYEAYIVGGCVRDLLLGRVPEDYDITTAALPAETQQVFAGEKLIETGLKHGTVTVLLKGLPLEITTFRVDGDYADGRHPDAVRFTPSLREDLARRDFTVNAMAYHPETGLADPFGGQADLRQGLLRCVGDPERRFAEDALRILRALRFAGTLGFQIEENTRRALLAGKDSLTRISAERVREELLKLLCGPGAGQVILDFPAVLGVVIPELLPMQGFDQRSVYHCHDVLSHCALALDAVPAEPVLRLAALLHDVGKPATFQPDENGAGHFYGHGAVGAELADAICRRLRLSTAQRERVVTLVRRHDMPIEATERGVRRALNRLTPEVFFQLLALKRADNLAQAPEFRERQAYYDQLEALAKELLAADACFSLRDLAVNGRDLLALGLEKGPAVGAALERLLAAVMDGVVPNEKANLLEWYQKQE